MNRRTTTLLMVLVLVTALACMGAGLLLGALLDAAA